MSFIQIQGKSGQSAPGTSIAINLGVAPGVGNLVICALSFSTVVTALVIQDSNSNAFTLTPNSPSPLDSSNENVYLGYMIAPSNRTLSITATWTGSSFGVLFLEEFDFTGSPVFLGDFEAVNNTGGTTINTPVISSPPGSLLYAYMRGAGTLSAPTNGGTLGIWTGSSGFAQFNSIGEYCLSSTGSDPVQWTKTTGIWTAMGMSFGVPLPLTDAQGFIGMDY